MSQEYIYEVCPKCSTANIQQLDKESWFCLDCDWDNLTEIATGNDELLTSLLHGDIHSRRIAAQSLINIGDVDRHLASPSDIDAMLKALDDEDADVRYFVAVALGKLDARECLKRLKQLAQDDGSALVREGAQTAIEQIESHVEKE
ncbi:HEAT repeat domain-containing protein [Candidatus Poribacteria bacterium]|nr:HEAT repeat domain-containing protein [Candidatus Poribacteria bacterium]MYI94818.1 HEAT repeat domain-containing protein [Candidatus Poribacteria bacterium]